jgi:hypothetical protein
MTKQTITLADILSDAATPLDQSDEATKRRIESYLKNPPVGSKLFTITPALAQWILDTYNIRNRGQKPTNVKAYALAMKQGRGSAKSPHGFPLTGDTLKFTDAGRLGDGQNRLLACIMAGVAFETHVVFGIEDWVFAFLDRGKNRNGGDVLTIAGYDYGQTLNAAIRWAELLANDPKSRRTPPPDETLQLMRDTYDAGGMGDRVEEAKLICTGPKGPTRPSVGFVAAVLWHCYLSDPKKAAQFANQWAAKGATKRRAGGVTRTPIAVMNRKLDDVYKANGRIHDVYRAAWAVIAWNLYKSNVSPTVRDFAWSSEDDFPEFD